MNEEFNKNTTDNNESQNENENKAENEKEFFERQYFEGDALKEDNSDDEDEDEASEDDENEYIKSFDGVNKAKKGKGLSGVQKRIIIISSVLAVALAVLLVYLLALRPNSSSNTEIDEDLKNLYFTSKGSTVLSSLEAEDVMISFSLTEAELKAGTYTYYVYVYAKAYANLFSYVSVEYGNGSKNFVTFKYNGASISVDESDFYNKLSDGTVYSHNSEIIYGKNILEITGNGDKFESDLFSPWAVSGYSVYGEKVINNRPFLYPSINRSDIKTLTVTNQNGTFTIYRYQYEDGTYSTSLYFKGAELCEYDAELFSSLIVNCTYVLATGRITGVTDFSEYGLDEENITAKIEIETNNGANHIFYIGDMSPDGDGYYARYIGGELNSNIVYLLDSSYQSDVLLPVNDFLTSSVGYNVSSTTEVYNISDLYFHYRNTDMNVYVTQKRDFVLSSTIVRYNEEQTVSKVLGDKVRKEGKYSSDWKTDTALCGVTSSSGNNVAMQMQLTNYADDTNKYSLSFGILRDDAGGAVLPNKFTLSVYDTDEDGNATYIDVAAINAFSQEDMTVKTYSVSFTYEKQVRYIKLTFDSPSGSYLVFDEITAYADGKDAIPNESITGVWKIVSPESFIRPGYNYAVPDTSALSTILAGDGDTLKGIAALTSDEVMEIGIYSGSEEEAMAILEKYGLNDPNLVIYYAYTDSSSGYTYKSYIYVSDLFTGDTADDRFYYTYSNIIATDSAGNTTSMTTNAISKIYYSSAPYLSWDAETFVDSASFSMYIDKIDTIEMTVGGKSYLFTLWDKDNNSKVDTVTLDGEELSMYDFRNLYVTVLECTKEGNYTVTEDDELTEIFRFRVSSEIKDRDIIYYRVGGTSKVVYSVDGVMTNYFVKYSSVYNITDGLAKLLAGESVPD